MEGKQQRVLTSKTVKDKRANGNFSQATTEPGKDNKDI